MKNIYGVDIDGKVTPLMVRDAIIECFRQAHCADAGVGTKDEEVNRSYCKEIVKKSFADNDSDFDNPTKEDILKAVNNLAEFAKNFRDQEMVKKHQEEIMKLIDKLE